MNRGSWRARVQRVAKSCTLLKQLSTHTYTQSLKDTKPFMRVPPPKGITNHLSKASPPNTLTLGVKLSTYEFQGHKQSVPSTLSFQAQLLPWQTCSFFSQRENFPKVLLAFSQGCAIEGPHQWYQLNSQPELLETGTKYISFQPLKLILGRVTFISVRMIFI